MRYSLLGQAFDNGRHRQAGVTHISTSQLLYTIYFYKVVSIFQPLYLIFFCTIVAFPSEILGRPSDGKVELYCRVLLGLSVVVFAWMKTTLDRCFGLLKNAFRARRICRDVPWPVFPDAD